MNVAKNVAVYNKEGAGGEHSSSVRHVTSEPSVHVHAHVAVVVVCVRVRVRALCACVTFGNEFPNNATTLVG